MRLQHRNECSSPIAVVHDVQDITGVAAQSIDAGDNQFVARPKEVDDGLQLGAAVARGA